MQGTVPSPGDLLHDLSERRRFRSAVAAATEASSGEDVDRLAAALLTLLQAANEILKYTDASARRGGASDAKRRYSLLLELLWSIGGRTAQESGREADYVGLSFVTIASFVEDSRQIGVGEGPGTLASRTLGPIARVLGGEVARLDVAAQQIARASGFRGNVEAWRAQRLWIALDELERAASPLDEFTLRVSAPRELDSYLSTVSELLQPTGMLDISRAQSVVASLEGGRRLFEGSSSEGAFPDRLAQGSSGYSRQRSPGDVDRGMREVEEAALFPLWFGTNREPAAADASGWFLGEPDSIGRVHYGICRILIPESHRFGSTGPSWITRILRPSAARRERHFIEDLLDLGPIEGLLSSVDEALMRLEADERSILVYIHGYNTSFERAAVRAAQISYDLNYPGLTALFSWPSYGKALAYVGDQDRVDLSVDVLSEFIDALARKTGAKKFDVVAHSMGNRLFAEALRRLASPHRVAHAQINCAILAAPDVGPGAFANLTKAAQTLVRHTTMYVSERDRALALAHALHFDDRVGFMPPVTVAQGIDTIAVARVDVSALGHDYVSSAGPVLVDMRLVLAGIQEPDKRMRMRRAIAPGGDYWLIGE